MKKLYVLFLIVLFISFVPRAEALTLDSVSGTWSNVIGDPSPVFQTVGSENQVRWGTSTGYGKSGLGFTGSAPPSLIFLPETEFEIGTLRHFNNPVYAPAATSVDLDILLNFSVPLINPIFTFTFGIDETPNTSPCAYPSSTPCADKIFFPSAFSSQTFDIGGTLYTLKLLGFKDSPDGTIVSDFISQEGGTNSTLLFGKVTTESVPEPAIALLLGSGLTGIAIYRARKKR